MLGQSCLSRCFNIRQACEYCKMRLNAVQFTRNTSQTLGTRFLFVSFPRLLVTSASMCAHFRPIGLVSVGVRVLLSIIIFWEQCLQWRDPLVVAKLDVSKAYDSVSDRLIKDALLHQCPDHALAALLCHILFSRSYRVHMAGWADAKHAFNRGLIQGCSSSPCLWNHLLAYLLAALLASWQDKVLGVRTTAWVWWGRFSYADDRWLLARNVVDLQVMLDDLVCLFKQAGLHFSETESQWSSVQPLDDPIMRNFTLMGYLSLRLSLTGTLMCLGLPIAARSRAKVTLQALR
eukprot:2952871-Amphidinium_carterae.1